MNPLRWLLGTRQTRPDPTPPVSDEPNPPPREPKRIIIIQEAANGMVVSGKAILGDDPNVYTKNEVPIDALGSFVLVHHRRLGIIVSDWSCPGGPLNREIKPGEVELAITIEHGRYSVELRAFTTQDGPEAHYPHSFRWPGWESKDRAVGMMVWRHAETIGLALEYDKARPIQVNHPEHRDRSGDGTDMEYDN